MGGFGIVPLSSLAFSFFFFFFDFQEHTCLCTKSLHFVILHVKARAQPWIDVHWQPPTCSEGEGEAAVGGGMTRENRKRESMRSEEEMIF